MSVHPYIQNSSGPTVDELGPESPICELSPSVASEYSTVLAEMNAAVSHFEMLNLDLKITLFVNTFRGKFSQFHERLHSLDLFLS